MTCDKLVVFSGSSVNKTDLHDIAQILLKMAINTITSNPYSLLSAWTCLIKINVLLKRYTKSCFSFKLFFKYFTMLILTCILVSFSIFYCLIQDRRIGYFLFSLGLPSPPINNYYNFFCRVQNGRI